MSIKTFLNKPYSRTYPKKRWLITILIFSWLILGAFFGSILNNNISASIITYSYGFESSIASQQVTYAQSGIFSTRAISGTFYTDVSKPYSGIKNFICDSPSVGEFNLTYSLTNFVTNISFWLSTESASGHYMYIIYYNATLGSSYPIMQTYFTYASANKHNELYINGVGSSISLQSVVSNGYANYFISVDDSIGTVTYGKIGYYQTVGTAQNGTAINQNYRIDRIQLSNYPYSGYYMCLDDMSFVISESYIGGYSLSNCVDYSEYGFFGNGFSQYEGLWSEPYPYVEITSYEQYSIKPIAFEVLVSKYQYDFDSDINNYYLSLNGNVPVHAECFENYYQMLYKLTWNVSGVELTNDFIIAELYHEGYSVDSWEFAYKLSQMPYSQDDYAYYSENSKIDGVWNGDNNIIKPIMWKCYYSEITYIEENPNYDNDIFLIGFNPSHPIYNLPFSYTYKTIFFDTYVSNTDLYILNISKDNVIIGQTQYYPKSLNRYHELFGYTPYNYGLYNIKMETLSGTVIVNKSFYIENLSVDYAIWTFPNPSLTYSSFTVGSFINNTDFSSYYIGVFDDIKKAFIYNSAIIKYKVGELTDNVFFSSIDYGFEDAQTLYIVLFGTNNNISFVPVTSPYRHYIQDIFTLNYVKTSLLDNNGFIDEKFDIFGAHSYINSDVRIYISDGTSKSIGISQQFSFEHTISKKGTYKIELRVYVDNTYSVLDDIIIIISDRNEQEPSNPIDIIPTVLKIPLGIGLAMLFLCVPLYIQYKAHIDINIFIYLFFGLFGLILSTILGLIPVIIVGVIILILVLIIIIQWLQRKMV